MIFTFLIFYKKINATTESAKMAELIIILYTCCLDFAILKLMYFVILKSM